MKNIELKFENDIIRTDIINSLAVLEFKNDAFSTMIEVEKGFTIINWYEAVKVNNNIKGILVYGDSNLFCETPYKKFISDISNVSFEELDTQKPMTLDINIRKKQINMLNNFTHSILEFPKMIINFINGCVVTPFIGLNLAADLRLATPEAKFSFMHKKFGLHPSGALPFFLSMNLGVIKTRHILYTKNELSAEELLELGLIDDIITPNSIDDVIKIAENLVEENFDTFRSTKELTNKVLITQYSDFMELEEKMVK